MIQSVCPDLKGKEAVIIGRSDIAGRPMGYLLNREDCTVTICHHYTKSLRDHVQRADIVIVAVGQKEIVKGEWFKEGAIAIDVGINSLDKNEAEQRGRKLVGDIEFETAVEKCSFISPVPGGVGPMTIGKTLFILIIIAMLMNNIVDGWERTNF